MDLIQGFLSSDAVRAAVGEASAHLPDQWLMTSGVVEELQLELTTWLPSGVTLEGTLSAAVAPNPSSEDLLKRKYLSAYCKYYAAYLVSLAGENLFLEAHTDGQNEVRRQTRDFSKLRDELLKQAEKYKAGFLEIGSTPSAQTGVTFIGKAAPSYDPITNETT